ncbi:RluA family pseudouridine synthase [Peptoniphilus obesi]|uniref:RluA family pseudouridine synthase n=1 Tax=Peptoniphilus obesi TaxID=1472765 RepID=UPI0004B02488|nr:RluA family pseudouridine synthase [Peptoniphilus obesi]
MKELIADLNNQRLDLYLLDKISLSRSQIKRKIDNGEILVNKNKVKAGYNIELGDIISIEEDKEIKLEKEDIDFKILYEDDHLAIISKPQDLVVHPGAGNPNNTLVNGLLYKFDNLAKGSDELRPGIVHRLDKDTSGLMIIAKSDEAYSKLVKMFKNRKIKKTYLAIVYGKLDDFGVIDAPIGRDRKNRKKFCVTNHNSKRAISKYKLLKNFDNYSLVKINLITGRTHQIRVHFSYIKHPIIGDPVYGYKNKFNIDKQLLHSYILEFKHPISGQEMKFEDDFPPRFKKFIDRFEK